MASLSPVEGSQSNPGFCCLPSMNVDIMRSCFVGVARFNGCFIDGEDGFCIGCVCSLLNGGVLAKDVAPGCSGSRIVPAVCCCSSISRLPWSLSHLGFSDFDGVPPSSQSIGSNFIGSSEGFAALAPALGLDGWISVPLCKMSGTSA